MAREIFLMTDAKQETEALYNAQAGYQAVDATPNAQATRNFDCKPNTPQIRCLFPLSLYREQTIAPFYCWRAHRVYVGLFRMVRMDRASGEHFATSLYRGWQGRNHL